MALTTAADSRLTQAIKQRMIDEIKSLAYQKIVAIAPEWKQRNMMAHSITLLQKGRENWTSEEAAMAEVYENIWARIAAIRAYSNYLEENLTPNTDITDGWPE